MYIFENDNYFLLETPEVRTQTCPTCGNFTVNPLVVRGIVPERLAQVLLPPPTKPLDDKKKSSRKRIEKGRVLSTQDMLEELKVQISLKRSIWGPIKALGVQCTTKSYLFLY